MIGIQGQTFLIPAVANIPARDVPLIVMLILAVMTLLIGWKVFAGAAVLHVFSGLSGQGAAPGAGPARAGGGALTFAVAAAMPMVVLSMSNYNFIKNQDLIAVNF